MQKAPVMKGSGLKPLDEAKTSDEVVHVFGTNLEERVLTKDEEDSQTISFVNEQHDTNQEEQDLESLTEQKFDTITGEEDEETAFQGEFKLFTWDLATSNWIEKGRGQLKLNDSLDTDTRKSRLIMRVGGTLKIVLNVAIRKSFKVISNTRSSIRFTDSQTVWAASGSNAQQLRDLIDERLFQVKDEPIDSKKRTRSDDDVPSKKTKSEDDSPSKETKTNADATPEKTNSDYDANLKETVSDEESSSIKTSSNEHSPSKKRNDLDDKPPSIETSPEGSSPSNNSKSDDKSPSEDTKLNDDSQSNQARLDGDGDGDCDGDDDDGDVSNNSKSGDDAPPHKDE